MLPWLAFGIGGACHATEYVWTGAAKDGFWTTPANWMPATGFPKSGDNVTLPPATAAVTINLHGDQAVRSVTFNPVAPFRYTIAGDTLTLDAGGKIHFLKLEKDAGMDDAAVQIITSELKLAGSASIGNENRWYFGGELCALELNGHRETLGTLDVHGHALIDCGKGTNVLHAGDSHGVAWDMTKELIVNHWKGDPNGGKGDQIVVGNSAAALTPAQLARVGFRDPAGHSAGLYTAAILKTGELVPATAVKPVNPPYDLSDKAVAERRKLYDVPGRAQLSGKGTPLKRDMKIAFFGDSITWGGGYIGVIGQALATGEGSKDLGVKLINHGVNGGGALTLRDGDNIKSHAGGTEPKPFAATIGGDKPEMAVIFIGVNDIWWRKTTPEDFDKALRDMVAAARANKTIPVLATLAVWGDSPAADNVNNARCDEYAGITRKVAAATGTTLVDLRQACFAYLQNNNRELRLDGSLRFAPTGVLTGDGVHTNAEGTELIADMISQGIVAALRKQPL